MSRQSIGIVTVVGGGGVNLVGSVAGWLATDTAVACSGERNGCFTRKAPVRDLPPTLARISVASNRAAFLVRDRRASANLKQKHGLSLPDERPHRDRNDRHALLTYPAAQHTQHTIPGATAVSPGAQTPSSRDSRSNLEAFCPARMFFPVPQSWDHRPTVPPCS
jgi:hypothetical protein